jgi:hypothetical protein
MPTHTFLLMLFAHAMDENFSEENKIIGILSTETANLLKKRCLCHNNDSDSFKSPDDVEVEISDSRVCVDGVDPQPG